MAKVYFENFSKMLYEVSENNSLELPNLNDNILAFLIVFQW